MSFKSNELRGAEALLEFINRCGWVEAAATGQYYTWTNNREGTDVVWERLDRLFTNVTWIEIFENSQVINFPVLYSNHGAMLVSTEVITPFVRRRYKLESIWITSEDCERVLKEAWNFSINGSPAYRLMRNGKAYAI